MLIAAGRDAQIHRCGMNLKSPMFLLLTLFCLLSATSQAQEPASGSAPLSPPPVSYTVVDETPPRDAFQRIDSVFESWVSALYKVLFYRLGKSEQTYVIYEPQSIFVRDRASSGPFLKLNPADDFPDDEISPDEMEILAAKNQLTPGIAINGQVQSYRWGKVGERGVDYIIIKRDERTDAAIAYGDKFILDPATDTFRKLGRKRGLLTDFTVPASTVAEWGAAGDLLTNPETPNSSNGYLHTEDVGGVPIIVGWLAAGSLFFTFYMQFFNVWGATHAIQIVRGKYDNPAETGEVTHFQALSSALSGTIGLGNIAGVTIAMCLGGPGAFFWMLVSGILGMATKFVECTLGLKYRVVAADGTVLGGPMRYLWIGLSELGLAPLGIILSLAFTVMCIFASFGGGNMLQANQSGSAMLHLFQHGDLDRLSELNRNIIVAADKSDVAGLRELQQQRTELKDRITKFEWQFKLAFGVVLSALVGVVIVGGIRRIGAAAEMLVPGMCLTYMVACGVIIARHLDRLPEVISLIFTEAFTGAAIGGGIVGTMVMGIQRAAFSNEAGAGSAPIAHSAARTEEPIREGCVALLEPFIDTIVVCSMTALVILITGAWDNDHWLLEQGLQGAALTSKAFEQEIWWFPYVLSIAVTLFAYSTIISWSYYGERSWAFLFGTRTTFIYKILAILCVFVGTVVNLGSVIDFSDMMILGMAFPNILGLFMLAPQVKRDLFTYWGKYKRGEFPKYH